MYIEVERSEVHLRAKIDDDTIAICFLNGIYPGFGDSIGKLVKFLGQQTRFLTRT